MWRASRSAKNSSANRQLVRIRTKQKSAALAVPPGRRVVHKPASLCCWRGSFGACEILVAVALFSGLGAFGAPEDRANVQKAILSEDAAEQKQLIQKLAGADDPLVQ